MLHMNLVGLDCTTSPSTQHLDGEELPVELELINKGTLNICKANPV